MTTPAPHPDNTVREHVRDHYADLAQKPAAGASCCSPEEQRVFGADRYQQGDRDELPEAAVLASLGCGNPTAVAELHAGEVVLDLGSGGGIDVLLSAKRVGPTGNRPVGRMHQRRPHHG